MRDTQNARWGSNRPLWREIAGQERGETEVGHFFGGIHSSKIEKNLEINTTPPRVILTLKITDKQDYNG